MLVNPLKMNKINLSDYPYEKDIECRILMAELTVFEVDVLAEIIHGSLKSTIHQISEHLEVTEDKLLPILEKLQKLNLYRLDGAKIFVDKEMRKYYESQVPKFDDRFRADLEFIKSLLNKVPIHVLPTWYSLPRSSDDIFGSIIDKHLLTPKIYQRYLDEITFDKPVLNEITNDIYDSPNYRVYAKDVMKKYNLTRELFEENMLLLEFSLVCCLSYTQSNKHWEEVITPFYEWKQFLTFRQKTFPVPITNPLEIERTHPYDFGFVQDMTSFIQLALKSPIGVEKKNDKYSIDTSSAKKILSHPFTDEYIASQIEILIKLQLIEIKKNKMHACDIVMTWQEKHLQEQAIAVYRYESRQNTAMPGDYIDRDLRETEKSLKGFMNCGWIYFEDFLKGCCAPIGENHPVMLIKKGKKWRYQIPEHSETDHKTIYRYLFHTLFYSGLIATGKHNAKDCFCVTPFGRMTMN